MQDFFSCFWCGNVKGSGRKAGFQGPVSGLTQRRILYKTDSVTRTIPVHVNNPILSIYRPVYLPTLLATYIYISIQRERERESILRSPFVPLRNCICRRRDQDEGKWLCLLRAIVGTGLSGWRASHEALGCNP